MSYQSQTQGYYPPQQSYPSQREWNPENIWAEANGQQESSQPYHTRGSGSGTSPAYGAQQHGQPYNQTQMQGQQGSGERGIGATVMGGGAGAFLGHELGHNKLATIGGTLIGAIAANALEHHEKKKHLEHRIDRDVDRDFESAERRDAGGYRSRGLDDGFSSQDDYYQDDRSYRDESDERYGYGTRRDYDYDDDYVQDDYVSRRGDYRGEADDQDDYYSQDRYYSRRDEY